MPASFGAQPLASVSGTVVDPAGVPIAGATVSIAGTQALATTDERGQFRLSSGTRGAATVSVRRLGFSPASADVSLIPGQAVRDLRIRMDAVPTLLSPVLIGARRAEYTGRLAGYYQRLERRSTGYFISRDEIDKKNYRNLSQLLKRIPGINAFPLRSGGATVRMRERNCRPLVWLDGVPMPAGEVDLDAFPVSTLHGIEAYPATSSTPQDFLTNAGLGCGTIVLWSRGPDTDPLAQRAREKVDLEKIIASAKAFGPDQVDERATLKEGSSLTVTYPPELLADALPGSVLVEFIVDVTGKIERETISVISSTHPLFSAAVMVALKGASYTPAKKAGNPVRQVVLQPFNFAPSGLRNAQGMR